MRRKILRSLLLTFIVGVFLMTAASLVLRFTLTPSALRTQILDRLYNVTGRTAGLGQATVSLTSGLVVKDFYLLDPAPSDVEAVSFDRASVAVSFWDLLQREVRVKSLELTNPHIELIIWPDGTTNFNDVLARLRGERHGTSRPSTVAAASPEPAALAETSRILNGQDGDEPLALDHLRIWGGSITINRYALDEREDRYLDINDLRIEVDDLSVEHPFPVRIWGTLGVERQATFQLTGTADPVARQLEGDLRIAELSESMFNSLLEFMNVSRYRLADGVVEDVELHISTREGGQLVDIDGEMDVDEGIADWGTVKTRVDGEVNIRASVEPREGTVTLTRLDVEISRPGANGELVVQGELNPLKGDSELRFRIRDLGWDTVQGVEFLPFELKGRRTAIDAEVRLTTRGGLLQGRLEGTVHAKGLELAVPAMLENHLNLEGLRVEGSMDFDLGSREFEVERSAWTLPGVAPPGNPMRLRGSSETGLSAVLPPLDLSRLSARLLPGEEEEDQYMQLARQIAADLGEIPSGMPIRLRAPRVQVANAAWSSVEGTLRVGEGALLVETLRGRIGSGEFTVTGSLSSTRREGNVEAHSVPVAGLESIWGVAWPGEVSGFAEGSFGGEIADGDRLVIAALDGRIEQASVADQWLLEEIAKFTGLEELRSWENADITVRGARDEETWYLTEFALSKADARLRLGGRLTSNESMSIGATVSVPEAVAERRARDPLFANAADDGEGWTSIHLSLAGTTSVPAITAGSAEQAEAIMREGGSPRVATLFQELSMTRPPGVEVATAPQTPPPVAQPEEPLAPTETPPVRAAEVAPPLAPPPAQPGPEPAPLRDPDVEAPPPQPPPPEMPRVVEQEPGPRRAPPPRTTGQRPRLEIETPPEPREAPAERDEGERPSEIVE